MENGSIVHIDYDLYNADDDSLIETTREEVAKEADKFDENRTYSPLVTVIGDGRLIAGFEAHLAEADAETDYEFDIAPEDAYGERDPNAVETMGQDVLARSVRDPDSLAIGGPVEINGKQGVLQMVSEPGVLVSISTTRLLDEHCATSTESSRLSKTAREGYDPA